MNNLDINKVKQVIAKQLKKLRNEKNETQEEVIKDIGSINLSLRSYKSYEQSDEDSLPSLEKLILLANHFNVPIDTLITGYRYTRDNSYSWESALKRLGRLIYTQVLTPYERNEEDRKANPHLSKYYFLPNDKETEIYIDEIFTSSKRINLMYYREHKKINIDPIEFDKKIGNLANLKPDTTITYERLKKIMENSGTTMEEYKKINEIRSKKY